MFRRKNFRLKLPSRTLLLGECTLVMGVLNVTADSISIPRKPSLAHLPSNARIDAPRLAPSAWRSSSSPVSGSHIARRTLCTFGG
jgi:hypothetical protein